MFYVQVKGPGSNGRWLTREGIGTFQDLDKAQEAARQQGEWPEVRLIEVGAVWYPPKTEEWRRGDL